MFKSDEYNKFTSRKNRIRFGVCLEKLVRIRFESRFTSFKPRRHLLQQPRVESSSVAEAASLKIAALLCCLFPV